MGTLEEQQAKFDALLYGVGKPKKSDKKQAPTVQSIQEVDVKAIATVYSNVQQPVPQTTENPGDPNQSVVSSPQISGNQLNQVLNQV